MDEVEFNINEMVHVHIEFCNTESEGSVLSDSRKRGVNNGIM